MTAYLLTAYVFACLWVFWRTLMIVLDRVAQWNEKRAWGTPPKRRQGERER